MLVQDYHLTLLAPDRRGRTGPTCARALPPHAVRRPRHAPGAATPPLGRSCSTGWPRTTPAGSTPTLGRELPHRRATAGIGTGTRPRRSVVAVDRPRRHPRHRRRRSPCRSAVRRARRAARRPPADRAGRPHRAVEEHRPRLPRLRPAARATHPTCAARSCSSPSATRRARACPSTPATATRSSAARSRSTTGGAPPTGRPIVLEHRRRLPPLGRRAAPLRRAAGEPDPRRAEPGGQGGSAGQRARRPCWCSSTEAGAWDELAAPRCGVEPVRRLRAPPTRSPRHSTWSPSSQRRRPRQTCARCVGRRARPADWLADQLAAAG